MINRVAISHEIFNKLNQHKSDLIEQYNDSKSKIGYFFIDDLLPEYFVLDIFKKFPKSSEMILKKSLRENKYVAAQMNLYAPILEEIIFAFQDQRIVNLISEICQINQITPDSNLYAGGISMMGDKQFLNPHLDNSHDKDRNQWRVLNLLYYVTPNWEKSFGANLELWPGGLQNPQISIHSKFNRLVVMATHSQSLHSVSPVNYDGFRCCISNYYFSEKPLQITDTFHVTSFYGRPENRITNSILKIDNYLRMSLRKIFKKGIKENPHVYKK